MHASVLPWTAEKYTLQVESSLLSCNMHEQNMGDLCEEFHSSKGLNGLLAFKNPSDFYGFCIKDFDGEGQMFSVRPGCLEVGVFAKAEGLDKFRLVRQKLQAKRGWFARQAGLPCPESGIGVGLYKLPECCMILHLDLSGVILEPLLKGGQAWGMIPAHISENEFNILPRMIRRKLCRITAIPETAPR